METKFPKNDYDEFVNYSGENNVLLHKFFVVYGI